MSDQTDAASKRADQRQGALLTCFCAGALPLFSWLVRFIQGDQRGLIMVGVTLLWLGLLTWWQVRPGPKWAVGVLAVVGFLPLFLLALLAPRELSRPGSAEMHTILGVLATVWLPAVAPVAQCRFRDAVLTVAGMLGVLCLAGSVVIWPTAWPTLGALAGLMALLSVLWFGWLVFWRKQGPNKPYRPWLALGALIPMAAVAATVARTPDPVGAAALAATLSLAGFAATALIPTNVVRSYPSVAGAPEDPVTLAPGGNQEP
ncbi:MAG: hypothetical protein L0G99_14865 [Propionibacteriales bacterium]|nr:hypothetical protein [Propionibacteriales bacterium]